MNPTEGGREHCRQRGVNSRPTPIYQPASPKQTDRQGSCPNRPVYLATAAERTGQWLFTLLPSPITVTHTHTHTHTHTASQGICNLPLGMCPPPPAPPTTPEKIPKCSTLRKGCPCSGLWGAGCVGELQELVTEMADWPRWATVTLGPSELTPRCPLSVQGTPGSAPRCPLSAKSRS